MVVQTPDAPQNGIRPMKVSCFVFHIVIQMLRTGKRSMRFLLHAFVAMGFRGKALPLTCACRRKNRNFRFLSRLVRPFKQCFPAKIHILIIAVVFNKGLPYLRIIISSPSFLSAILAHMVEACDGFCVCDSRHAILFCFALQL
jgi:hypothetical protein